jgi:hypothetical protein
MITFVKIITAPITLTFVSIICVFFINYFFYRKNREIKFKNDIWQIQEIMKMPNFICNFGSVDRDSLLNEVKFFAGDWRTDLEKIINNYSELLNSNEKNKKFISEIRKSIHDKVKIINYNFAENEKEIINWDVFVKLDPDEIYSNHKLYILINNKIKNKCLSQYYIVK